MAPSQINLQGSQNIGRKAAKKPYSSSSSSITSLWFLSDCYSVNFCGNRRQRDRGYSKIVCLLDLPGMERLFILRSLLFCLQPFFFHIAAAVRPDTCLSCISLASRFALTASTQGPHGHTRANGCAPFRKNKCPGFSTVSMSAWTCGGAFRQDRLLFLMPTVCDNFLEGVNFYNTIPNKGWLIENK